MVGWSSLSSSSVSESTDERRGVCGESGGEGGMAGVMVAERRTSETRISIEPDMSRLVGILTVRVPMTA